VKFRVAGAFQEDVGDVVFLDGLPRLFLQLEDPLELLDLLLIDGHDSMWCSRSFFPRSLIRFSLTNLRLFRQKGGECLLFPSGDAHLPDFESAIHFEIPAR